MKVVFSGYGLKVTETEAGHRLIFDGVRASLDAGGTEALVEALRKWRSASLVQAHLRSRTANASEA